MDQFAEDRDREGRRAEFRREHQLWSERGVDVTTWSRDPTTGLLTVGVRSGLERAEPLLRARYGDGTVVVLADVRPA